MTNQEYMTLIKEVFPKAENIEINELIPSTKQITMHNIFSLTSADLDKLHAISFAFNAELKYLVFTTKIITD